MADLREEIALILKSHPLYEEFENMVLAHRPDIPTYNAHEDNTNDWKFKSAKQEGFDLCLTLFKIGVEE